MSAQIETSAMRPDRTGFAVAMIIFGTSTVACSDLATKWLTTNLSLWQLQSMRSVFGISFLLLVLVAMRKMSSLKVINVEAVVIRSLLMTCTYLMFFTSLAVLPIAMVAGGFFSGPLFMVILASVMLKEAIGIWLLGLFTKVPLLGEYAKEFNQRVSGYVYRTDYNDELGRMGDTLQKIEEILKETESRK